MSYDDLRNAIAELKKIYAVTDLGLVKHADIVPGSIVADSRDSESSEVTLESRLRRLLMDMVDGGQNIAAINRQIREFVEDTTSSFDFDESGTRTVLYEEGDFLITPVVNLFTGRVIDDMFRRTTSESNPKAPSKQNPNLAFIQAKSVDLVPGTRETEATALCMNAIPSYEWSRAIPYLSVNVISPQQAVDDAGRMGGITLNRFFLGRETVSGPLRDFVEAGEIDLEGQKIGDRKRQINESLAAIGREGIEIKTKTVSGMELFTSPQTLVNADEGSGDSGLRYAPIIDKFRPLASVSNFTVEIATSGHGAIPYKHGKLNLVVYDRSRLGEVAELIRPDQYGNVELLIEFGWAHPDGHAGSDNVFGRFINALRVKEKYMVKNSSFNFEEGGQVSIALEIVTKGFTDLNTSKIADTPEVQSASRQVQDLIEAIGAATNRISANERMKDVIPTEILDSVSNLEPLRLSPELKKKVQKLLTTNYRTKNGGSAPAAVGELKQNLRELLGPRGDGTGGAAANLNTSLQDALDDKFEAVKNKRDSILYSGLSDLAGLEQERGLKGEQVVSDRLGPAQGFVSLGKLLLIFLGQPLIATSRFDEVQLVTYPFNDACGLVRNTNIGSFPIYVPHFEQRFKEFLEANKRFNVTIQEFLEYIINNYIDDITHPAYGITNKQEYQISWKEGAIVSRGDVTVRTVPVYPAGLAGADRFRVEKEAEDAFEAVGERVDRAIAAEKAAGRVVTKEERSAEIANQKRLIQEELKTELSRTKEVKLSEAEVNALRDKRHDRIAKMGLPGGEFRKAEVTFQLEAVPKKFTNEDDFGDTGFTILRIHVLDQAASPYASVERMLESIKEKNLSKLDIDLTSEADVSGHRKKAKQVLQDAEKLGLVVKVATDEGQALGWKINPQVKPRAIKRFVQGQMPSIRYGVQNSAVNSMRVNSKHDGQLGTVHMLQMFDGDPTVAPGIDGDIVPLRLQPTELTMETLGCPFFNFTQRFFIDLDTGTTVDNAYWVTSTTYTVEAGKFTTQVKMHNAQAFGVFRSVIGNLQIALNDLDLLTEGLEEIKPPPQKPLWEGGEFPLSPLSNEARAEFGREYSLSEYTYSSRFRFDEDTQRQARRADRALSKQVRDYEKFLKPL